MKALINFATVIFFLCSMQGQAESSNRWSTGLIIGGGAGALLGQAAGRDAESTIIGAAVGGILGAALGSGTPYRHSDGFIVYDGLYGLDLLGGGYLNYAPGYNRPYYGYTRLRDRGYNTGGDTVIIIRNNCDRGYLYRGDCGPDNRGYYRLRQSDYRRMSQDTPR